MLYGDIFNLYNIFLYNEQGEACAENKKIETSYFIQVDIWTKDDFTVLYNQVLSLMK